ncbi:MAG: 3-deoxy-8-phosphooctulonate synthase [Deltaproteobacteria bacterium]|nr:3-deoxy-8-phosphooctulonate synthase [Candidatus Tharpellaceae bacterium]
MYNKLEQSHFIIAGPCVIENELITLTIAERISKIRENFNDILFIFKASFDKANRSSVYSFRGLGIEKGLNILKKVKQIFNLPLITDIHLPGQADMVKDVVDIIQIPALLSRQTDLIVAAAKTGKIINIKKGQFTAPWDMKNAVEKVKAQKNEQIMVTERGTCFGYNNLVVDFRSMLIMKEELNCPIVFDATHSMQLPGGKVSGGTPGYAPSMAKAATAIGVDGLFFEVHAKPEEALSDASSMLDLKTFEQNLPNIIRHWQIG